MCVSVLNLHCIGFQLKKDGSAGGPVRPCHGKASDLRNIVEMVNEIHLLFRTVFGCSYVKLYFLIASFYVWSCQVFVYSAVFEPYLFRCSKEERI
jgi:hypothetical protein